MGLVRETIGKFKGFGNDGNTPGEFLLSQNIKKSDFGCKVGWRASSLFTPLAKILNFSDGFYGVNVTNDSIAKAPGTTAEDATEGTIAWANINNSKAEDAVYASSKVAVSNYTYTPHYTPHYTSVPHYATAYASQTLMTALAENDGSIGTDNWELPYRAQAEDGNNTKQISASNNVITNYLKCTNFGFSVPSGATITGVSARVKKYEVNAGATIADYSVRMIKNGAYSGNNKADMGTEWSTSLTNSYYGGDGDLWGNSLSSSDVNASDFGVGFSAMNYHATYEAYVDCVEITVYYSYQYIDYYTQVHDYDIHDYDITDPATTTPACAFNTVKLVSGDAIVGDDKATGELTTSNANYNFGGGADLWGTSLTPAIVNAADFGCVVNFLGSLGVTTNSTTKFIKATNFGFSIDSDAIITGIKVTVKGMKRVNVAETGAYNSYADIDYISITVYYTLSFAGKTDGNWRQDSAGRIYASMFSPDDLYYVPKSNDCASNGGLITDQKGRLIYAGTRYVGMYDGGIDYATGTITATNGSTAIVGSGTTFAAGMVGQVIKIGTSSEALFYKIATFTNATSIAITENYAGVTGAGKNLRVFTKWTDQKWDLGADFSNLKPLELYEDYILIPVANNLALISTTDDSLNVAAFTLPTGFTIEGTKSGENGLLIGANDKRKKGYVILWDCLADRSIAPWIPLEDTLKSIVKVSQGWIVIGTQKIYLTNGYSIQVLKENFPDDSISRNYIYPLTFNGATVIGNTLFIANAVGTRSRSRKGIYAIDIPTVLMEFITVASGEVYGETNFEIPALYASLGSEDSQFRLLYSSVSEASAIDSGQISEVSDIETSFNPQWFITQPFGASGNDKVFESIILSMQYDFSANAIALFNEDLTITVKACSAEKSFFQYGTHATGGSGNDNEIYLNLGDGTLEPFVEVGDEITILNGVNAGQIRHVLTVANDTNNLVITVDADFDNTPEVGSEVSIIPLKKIATLTVSHDRGLKNRFFVDVKNRLKGRKFLVKVEIAGYNPYIEFGTIDVIYDDKGIK